MKIIHLFSLLILASTPGFAQSTYTPYTFTTLAGTANSSGSANGMGSAARFNEPSGLAVDSAGNVYVADSANHTLRKITPTGVVTTLAGMVGSSGRTDGMGSGAQFGYPSGVAVDGAGNVYVAEWENHALRKVTPAGVVTTLAGQNDSAAHFNHPFGVAVEANGNVYVADSDNHTLRKVTPKGVVTTLAGLAGNYGGADGTGSAARFYAPVDVDVDSLGHLYVADLFNRTIRKVTPAGVVTTLVGRAEGDGNPDGRVGFVVFNYPHGVAVDSAGNVYVAEADRIRKVTPAGGVTTLAGGGSGRGTDGTGSAVQFNGPRGIAVDSEGNIYVADTGNHTIRKGFPTLHFASPTYGALENAGSAAIEVNLGRAYTNQITVDYVTNDGTAVAGLNYTATSGMLTFLPGQTTATFSVPIINDSRVENSKTVNLTLSHATGGVPLGGPTNALLTISDNDFFTLDSYGAYENEPSVSVRVRRNGDVEVSSTIHIFTSDGTAKSRVDYWAQGGTLTFVAGETDKVFTLTIPVLDNGRVDGDRAFYINLNNGAGFSSQSPITILDNEMPALGNLSFNQGSGVTLQNLDPGLVNAMVIQNDGKILIGGRFDAVNDIGRTNLARLNADGSVDTTFAADTRLFDSSDSFLYVSVLATQTNGTVLVSGNFSPTMEDEGSRNRLLRLNGDGSLDTHFNASAQVALTNQMTDSEGRTGRGIIKALATQSDGKILLGGTFDTVNGVSRTNLARLNADGTLDTRFVAGTELTNSSGFASVDALALQPGGGILVGGTFATVNGADRASIARLKPDGSLDDSYLVGDGVEAGDGPGTVKFIIEQPDGETLIAGKFSSVHGVGRNNLARLNGDGSLDPGFNPAENAGVDALAMEGDEFVLIAEPVCEWGCSFRVRRLNPDGSLVDYTPLVSGKSRVNAMVVQADGNVVIGGSIRYRNWNNGGDPLPRSGIAQFYGNPSQPFVQFTSSQDPETGAYSADINVSEGPGFATISVQRLGETGRPLTVEYATHDATATAGVNYVATRGTLTFAPLEDTKTINIPILNDPLMRGDLEFKVVLDHPTGGGMLGLNTLTVTVRNTDSIFMPYTFTTLAGSVGQPGSLDGTVNTARFGYPFGVAVDGAGVVYVADTFNHTIRKVTPAGEVTTLAGLAGSQGSVNGSGSAARFSSPFGVAVDGAGAVYVADTFNHSIRKVTPAGGVTTLAGLASNAGSADGIENTARFNNPYGVAVDGTGVVYVADCFNHTIRKVTPAGEVTTLAGVAGSSGSADGSGKEARFSYPYSVAVDGANNIYVADTGNSTIRKVTPAGEVITLAGLAGRVGTADGIGSAARFRSPRGVATDGAGNVYVADTSNNTIRRITPAGVVSTLAGRIQLDHFGNPLGGTADGTGSAVRFAQPWGVAVDSLGNVYVADSIGHTIRKGYSALAISRSGPGFGFKDGLFGFSLTGPSGKSVIVETSIDLVNWQSIWTNTFTGSLTFRDLQSGRVSDRFYRAVQP